MSSIVGWIAGAGIVTVLMTIGAGCVWFYNAAYSAGKKSAKLTQAEKEIDDAKRAGEIMGQQKTKDDTVSDLNSGQY